MELFPDELAAKLAALKGRLYNVERFLAGHERLTILARPVGNGDPVYITFSGTEYMQMPSYWMDSPFALGTPDECRNLLEQVGIERKRYHRLFYVQLPKLRGNIVCAFVEMSSEMPPY